jgi:putative LysE/RhtB family amino acid efflux pump
VTSGATGDAALVVLGVLLGSTAWWVVLTTAIGMFRARITHAWIHRINVASGIVIGAFAVVTIASVFVAATASP